MERPTRRREHIRKGILSQCPRYAFIWDDWNPYSRELPHWGGGSGMGQTPDSSLIYIPAKERNKVHWTNRRKQTWTWFCNLVARHSCGMGDTSQNSFTFKGLEFPWSLSEIKTQQHPGLWEEHFIAKHIFKQNATKKRKRIKKKKKEGKKSYKKDCS